MLVPAEFTIKVTTMDFIDYCHNILHILEEQKYNLHLSPLDLGRLVYTGDNTGAFWGSGEAEAFTTALDELKSISLVGERGYFCNITELGGEVLHNPHILWEPICKIKLGDDEKKLLELINRLSPRIEYNPSYVQLEKIGREQILEEFGLPLPAHWGDPRNDYKKVLNGIPYVLSNKGLLNYYGTPGEYSPKLTPTYKGMVWEKRRGFTLETRFIDNLVKEWETTNVDFKQELHLDTKEQRGTFAKDILSLVNTKSSGKRYLIVGYEDKTHCYYGPPDDSITQNRIEAVLNHLTYPVVCIRYEVVDCRDGKVGKIQVLRDSHKLPYRAACTVRGANNKIYLKKDSVYVRHNTMNEDLGGFEEDIHPELKNLIEEGEQARNSVIPV